MSDEKIEVEIGANETGLAAGMRSAVEAVAGGTEGMKAALEGLGGAFEAVMAPLLAFVAVLKGGEFLKESVDETVNFYKEAGALGRQLGISSNEAAQLGMALKGVNSSSEDFSGAASRLTRQIKQNEDGIKAMGLETRNADGSLRNSKDLMLDAIQVLNGYKEGTDRNLAAQTLFGRGAATLGPLLKLNSEALEEAKQKQEELGLTVTKEGTEAVAEYRKSLAEAKEVMEGVSVTVGNAVIPILTELGNWFAEIGPTVVAVFKGAMDILSFTLQAVIDIIKLLWDSCVEIFQSIASLAQDDVGGKAVAGFLTWDNILKAVKLTLLALKEAIEDVIIVVMGFVNVTIQALQTWHNIVTNLLSLNWAGVKKSWDDGLNGIENSIAASANRIKKLWADDDKAAAGILAGPKAGTPTSGPSGAGRGYVAPDDGKGKKGSGKEQNRSGEWENKLNEQKLALEQENQNNGTFYAFSKQQEADYWQNILNTVKMNSAERESVQKKYLDAALAQRKQDFDGHIANLKAEMEAFTNNMDERLRIATEISNEMRQRFGQDSKEYQQAQGEIIKIEKAKAEQLKALNAEISDAHTQAALDQVDAAQAASQQELDLGKISQQEMIAREQQFENDRYAINLAALNERLQLMALDPDKNPVEYQKIKDQILQIERQHQQAIQGLQNQAVLAGTATQRQAISSLSQSWGQTLSGMLAGQMNFAQGVRAMWTGLVGAITQALAGMIAQYIAKQLAALILGKAQGAISAGSQITANAGVAGSAAWASTAAIPIIGPALAPAAAATAVAGALGFLPMAAASRGYDIPSGVNPITQLHQKEMVLPAEQADVIRGMAGGAKGNYGDIHFHAPSGMSQSEMERHASTLVRVLRNEHKNRAA